MMMVTIMIMMMIIIIIIIITVITVIIKIEQRVFGCPARSLFTVPPELPLLV